MIYQTHLADPTLLQSQIWQLFLHSLSCSFTTSHLTFDFNQQIQWYERDQNKRHLTPKRVVGLDPLSCVCSQRCALCMHNIVSFSSDTSPALYFVLALMFVILFYMRWWTLLSSTCWSHLSTTICKFWFKYHELSEKNAKCMTANAQFRSPNYILFRIHKNQTSGICCLDCFQVGTPTYMAPEVLYSKGRKYDGTVRHEDLLQYHIIAEKTWKPLNSASIFGNMKSK